MKCQKETSSCHIFIYYERATYSKIANASEGEFDLLDLCRSQRLSKEAFPQKISWWLFKGLHNLSETKFPHHRAESSFEKRWKGQGLHFLTVPQTLLINDISNEGKIRPWCQCFDHDAIFNDSKKHLRGWSRTIITSLMTSCHQKQHFWWQRWHHWSKGLSFLASPFSHQRRVLMERFWSFMILMS